MKNQTPKDLKAEPIIINSISSNYPACLLRSISVVVAEPTCGKTTYKWNNRDHNSPIIELDDVQFEVKTRCGLSGWDIIDAILINPNDVSELQEWSDYIDNVSAGLCSTKRDAINAMMIHTLAEHINIAVCSLTPDDNIQCGRSLTIMCHHPSLMFLVLAGINTWIKNQDELVVDAIDKLNCMSFIVYRDEADSYAEHWLERQRTKSGKNKQFSYDELIQHHSDWIKAKSLLISGFLGENAMELELTDDQYLSDLGRLLCYDHSVKIEELDEARDWNVRNFALQTDSHRYEVATLAHIGIQRMWHQIQLHDVDKYAAYDLNDWKSRLFNNHRSSGCQGSKHHKENVENVAGLFELLCDWISASARRTVMGPYDVNVANNLAKSIDLQRLVNNQVKSIISDTAWYLVKCRSVLVFGSEDEFNDLKSSPSLSLICDRKI